MTTTPAEPRPGAPARRAAAVTRVAARTARHTAHLLAGAPVAALAAGYLLVTGYALLAGVTVVGLPLLAGLVTGARWLGAVERWRARTLLRLTLPVPAPRRRTRPGAVGWVRDALADRVGWRCLGHAVLAAPIGAAQAYLVALLWGEALATTTYPLWYRLQPRTGDHYGDRLDLGGWQVWPDRWPWLVAATGLLAVALTVLVVGGLAAADRWRLRVTLPGAGTPPAAVAERRRDRAVAQAGAHLRRIERDLHDGAQVRMVALAMELGRAREEIEAGDDPQRVAARVAAAHEDAKLALAELRDLARGIYPAVLTDLGLDGAVPMLAARCPVPVTVRLAVDRRPGTAAESTAYFCIGELLTNAARHSGATAVTLDVQRRGDTLRVVVGDDGAGGASATPGGGLAGLTDRADSVGGTLTLSSPPGGPTVVTVELPCGS